MTRTMNFNPGPAALPLEVLEEARAEFLDFAGTGMSVLEVSHRSPEYDKVHNETQETMRRLLGIPDNYKILFMGGGASTQFYLVPSNFMKDHQPADYILTGTWSKKAFKEAGIIGDARLAATTEENGKFTRIPSLDECRFTDGATYVHITSNNTIFGTQWHTFPKVDAPLIADMSSDFLWKPFDINQFAMVYAGAQKNLGPAGVTVVVIREDFAASGRDGLPTMMSYKTFINKNSLFNTPPCFAIYLVGKTMKWLEAKGGLEAQHRENVAKAELLYATIDKYRGFYRAPVETGSRSYMNVVFRLPSEELEKRFVAESKEAGMNGLKGHRSVGGMRASIYNAVPLAWVEALADFMDTFAKRHG